MTDCLNYYLPYVLGGAFVFFVAAALVSALNQPPPKPPRKPDHGRRVR